MAQIRRAGLRGAIAWTAASLVFALTGVQGASAQSPAQVANYQGADRNAYLEAGARREGQLTLYVVGTQTDPVYQAFAKKYPFLKVDVVRTDSALSTRRIIEEYAAQTYLVDAVELSSGAMGALRDAGLLQPFWSPELAAFRKEAIEPRRHWAIDYESYLGLGYNTKVISDADAPHNLNDLLDPKWQGKMAIAGTTTLGNWIGALLRDKDEAFVRRLGTQKIKVFEVSARAIANMVIAGEAPLSPTIFASHVTNSRAQGAAFAWRALDGAYASSNGVAMATRAPHPHAAMLFLDYELSHEGQVVNTKIGNASARLDVADMLRPERVYYLGDDPDYQAKYEKWLRLGREVFGGKYIAVRPRG
jgi:iron(III) transport system substrate-binding protein